MAGRRNFIESEDFEAELGSPAANAFAEDFSDVAKHEIVDVVGAYLPLFSGTNLLFTSIFYYRCRQGWTFINCRVRHAPPTQ